ncbi:MAG: hypothetical protein J6U19_05455 [Oscillospiraceae bacterium]|nr:hypothetical protein [Oscillospiraceae bacterium]
MERTEPIRYLSDKITNLASMHVIYGLQDTQSFRAQKNEITEFVRFHQVNVKAALDPLMRNLYQRHFI